ARPRFDDVSPARPTPGTADNRTLSSWALNGATHLSRANAMETLWAMINGLENIVKAQLPWAIGLSILFTVLSLFQSQACNPGRRWWRSRDLLTDIQYF